MSTSSNSHASASVPPLSPPLSPPSSPAHRSTSSVEIADDHPSQIPSPPQSPPLIVIDDDDDQPVSRPAHSVETVNRYTNRHRRPRTQPQIDTHPQSDVIQIPPDHHAEAELTATRNPRNNSHSIANSNIINSNTNQPSTPTPTPTVSISDPTAINSTIQSELQRQPQSQQQLSQSTSSPAIKRRRTSTSMKSETQEDIKKEAHAQMKYIEDEDEGNACPICLEPWTNSGSHQICCLPCGHLFGYHCIKEWLKSKQRSSNSSSSKQPCPTCKHVSRIRDIRFLFGLPTKPSCADNSKSQRLQKELKTEIEKHNGTKEKLADRQRAISLLRNQIKDLKSQQRSMKLNGDSGLNTRTFGAVVGSNGNQNDKNNSSNNSNNLSLADYINRNCLNALYSLNTEGDTQTATFDIAGRLLFCERYTHNNGTARFRLKRLSFNSSRATSTPIDFPKRIVALSVCRDNQSNNHGRIAVGIMKEIRILSSEMQTECSITTTFVVSSITWFKSNSNIIAVGSISGEVILYDIRLSSNGGSLTRTFVNTTGWRNITSLSEIKIQHNDINSMLIATTPKAIYGSFINSTNQLSFQFIYEPAQNEKIWSSCIGVDNDNMERNDLIGILTQSETTGGRMSVYDGIVIANNEINESEKQFKLGRRIGQKLSGLSLERLSKASIVNGFNYDQVNHPYRHGGAVVVCPDGLRPGGLAAWTLKRNDSASSNNDTDSDSNNDNADNSVQWIPITVDQKQPTNANNNLSLSQSNFCFKGTSLFVFPQSTRLDGLPSGCKSIFVGYGDQRVCTFTCGQHIPRPKRFRIRG